eukprot:2337042-Rhodomonas_salina.4
MMSNPQALKPYQSSFLYHCRSATLVQSRNPQPMMSNHQTLSESVEIRPEIKSKKPHYCVPVSSDALRRPRSVPSRPGVSGCRGVFSLSATTSAGCSCSHFTSSSSPFPLVSVPYAWLPTRSTPGVPSTTPCSSSAVGPTRHLPLPCPLAASLLHRPHQRLHPLVPSGGAVHVSTSRQTERIPQYKVHVSTRQTERIPQYKVHVSTRQTERIPQYKSTSVLDRPNAFHSTKSTSVLDRRNAFQCRR